MLAFNYYTAKHSFLWKKMLFFKIMLSLSRRHHYAPCTLHFRQTPIIIQTSQTLCALHTESAVTVFVGSYCQDRDIYYQGPNPHYIVCQTSQAIQYLKRTIKINFLLRACRKKNKTKQKERKRFPKYMLFCHQLVAVLSPKCQPVQQKYTILRRNQ